MKRAALVAALICFVLSGAGSAAAVTPCGDAVLRDWADGRIDDEYAPRCYADAVDALPEDVRAYTTAADDIAQAMRARIRELRSRQAAAGPTPGPGEPARTVPLPLVSGAVVAALVVLAGIAALAVRALRRLRLGSRPARPIGHW